MENNEKILRRFRKDLTIYKNEVGAIFSLLLAIDAENDKTNKLDLVDYFADQALSYLEKDGVCVPYRGSVDFLLKIYEENRSKLLDNYKEIVDENELDRIHNLDMYMIEIARKNSGKDYNLLEMYTQYAYVPNWWKKVLKSDLDIDIRKLMYLDILCSGYVSNTLDLIEKDEETKKISDQLFRRFEYDKDQTFGELIRNNWQTLVYLQESKKIDLSDACLEYGDNKQSAIDYVLYASYAYENAKKGVSTYELAKLLYTGDAYTEYAPSYVKQSDIINMILKFTSFYSTARLEEIFGLDFKVNSIFISDLADRLRENFEYSLERSNVTKKQCSNYRDKVLELIAGKVETKEELEELKASINEFMEKTDLDKVRKRKRRNGFKK